MGTYRLLLSVTVEHEYFSNHRCKALEFIPTGSCNALLHNAGLLLRTSENGIAVYFDHEQIKTLRLHAAEHPSLTFKIFSKDPNFFRYTAPGAPPDQAMLYFSNQQVTKDVSGMQLLHTASYVTETAWQDMNAEPLADILERKDLLVKPAFIVQIALNDNPQGLFSDTLETPDRKYYIRFTNNLTFWNYYLLGDLANRNVYIADLDNALKFKSIGNVQLPGNRQAILMQSSVAIPLQEQPAYRLQLRESATMGDKILIKRLPNASIQQIHGETVNGKIENVSEIFIG